MRYLDDENEEEKKSEEKMPLEGIAKTRAIVIAGEINQERAGRFANEMLYLEALSNDPIKVLLHSQGGHVESGYAIYDMIRFVKPEVYILGFGWVASAGVTIFLSAKKEYRYCLPNTRFLIHQPSGGVRGQASDIRIEAEEMLKARKKTNELISRETGVPIDKIAKDADRNFWLSAEEAKEYGLVTNIVESANELPH